MEAELLPVLDLEVSFFSLPLRDVVFPHIFSRLDILEIWGLRVVSKQFLAICEEYFRVCPSLHFDQHQERQRFSIYLSILRRCETLQSFYMRGLLCNHVLPASLAENHQILVLTLAEIPSTFRKLSLENLELHQVQFCMEKLAGHCSELKELFLCSIVQFDDEALDKLTMSCTTLVKLTLQNLPIRGHSLVRLASQCPELQHLNVSLYCIVYLFILQLSIIVAIFILFRLPTVITSSWYTWSKYSETVPT